MPKVTAIVLAGDRSAADPLLLETASSCKALVELRGETLLARIFATLQASKAITRRWLVAPLELIRDAQPELLRELEATGWQFSTLERSPATSARVAISAVQDEAPILLTTVDHGLLTPQMVDTFARDSSASGADITVAFAPYDVVMSAFPDTTRTGWKFSDGRFCGCNLYWLANPRAHKVVELWQEVEGLRKSPWRIVRMLGLGTLLRYLLGQLDLQQALDRLGQRVGASIAPVILQDAKAAVDVDTFADLQLAEGVLERESGPA